MGLRNLDSEDLEKVSNEVSLLLGWAKPPCLGRGRVPVSARPRCMGRKKRLLCSSFGSFRSQDPALTSLIPKEKGPQRDKEPTEKRLVPVTFLLMEQTPSQCNSVQQDLLTNK